MKKVGKKELIIIILSLTVILCGIIITLATSGPIKYETKYTLEEGQYYLFHKDGTCERNKDSTCTYEIKDNDIFITEVQEVLGSKLDAVLAFYIIDKYNIEHYESTVLGIKLENGQYGNVWSSNGKSKKVEIITDESDNNQVKEYYKKFNLLQLKDGKTATIEFLANGFCNIDFSSFNNRSKGRDYISVTYTPGVCTYTEINDHNLLVKYTGKVSLDYNWYHDYYKKMQKTNNGTGYVLEQATLEFDDNYASFKLTNGEWQGQTGEVFYYYFATHEDIEKEKDNKNNNEAPTDGINDIPKIDEITKEITQQKEQDNSSQNYPEPDINQNDNQQSSSNDSKNEPKEMENYLDGVTIKTEKANGIYNDYTWYVILNDPNRNGEYKVTYEGRVTYAVHKKRIIETEFQKNGKNCVSFSLEDSNGNKKDYEACENFTASEPDYSIQSAGSNDTTCSYNIFRGNKEGNLQPYNSASNLTCSLDGEDFNCKNTAVSVPKGSHMLVYANKYTSKEIDINC